LVEVGLVAPDLVPEDQADRAQDLVIVAGRPQAIGPMATVRLTAIVADLVVIQTIRRLQTTIVANTERGLVGFCRRAMLRCFEHDLPGWPIETFRQFWE